MRLPKGRFERMIVKVVLWLFLVFLVFIGVLLLGATWEAYQKEQQARDERDAALLARDSLTERKERIGSDLSALANERGLEAEFRERFPVAKAGEEVIVLVEAKSGEGEKTGEEARGFWATFTGWLGF